MRGTASARLTKLADRCGETLFGPLAGDDVAVSGHDFAARHDHGFRNDDVRVNIDRPYTTPADHRPGRRFGGPRPSAALIRGLVAIATSGPSARTVRGRPREHDGPSCTREGGKATEPRHTYIPGVYCRPEGSLHETHSACCISDRWIDGHRRASLCTPFFRGNISGRANAEDRRKCRAVLVPESTFVCTRGGSG